MIVKMIVLPVFVVLFNVWSIDYNGCYSLPIDTQKLDDTLVVDSVIREVRAAPPHPFHLDKKLEKSQTKDLVQAGTSDDPDNWEQHWSTGDKGDKGYIKNAQGKGSSGYKHFDSYHKKDGDKYDFEHHTAFGHGDKNEKEHHSKYSDAENNEDVEKNHDKKNRQEETQNSYQVAEDVAEDHGYNDEAQSPLSSNTDEAQIDDDQSDEAPVSGNLQNEDDDDETQVGNYSNEDDTSYFNSLSPEKSDYSIEQEETADDTDGDNASLGYTSNDSDENDESESKSADGEVLSQFTDTSDKDGESENLDEEDLEEQQLDEEEDDY